jgi:hypothetical protein
VNSDALIVLASYQLRQNLPALTAQMEPYLTIKHGNACSLAIKLQFLTMKLSLARIAQ